MRRNVVAATVASILELAVSHPLAQVQSKRSELIASVRDVCQTARQQLTDRQLPALKRKRTAFVTFFNDWDQKVPLHLREEKMPVLLQAGLNREMETFTVLIKGYDATESLIDACLALPERSNASDAVPLVAGAKQLSDGLQALLRRWQNRPAGRATFKDLLEKNIGLLMVYNPSDASTYITLRLELDPDRLDQLITYQNTIVSSMQIAFDLLK